MSKDVNDKLKESIWTLSSLLSKYISENYIYGFKQTSRSHSEKLLSPGINNPGTAIRAVDHLTLLYSEMLNRKMDEHYFDSDGCLRIIQRNDSLDDLLYNYLTPIREYGNKDVNIILRLLKCFETLLGLENEKQRYSPIFHKHIDIIKEDADNNIVNKIDRKKINEVLENLNRHFADKEQFQKI